MCVCVCTHLCVQTEHTDLSSVDDLSHRVCTRPVQVLLKLTGLDQLSWEKTQGECYLSHMIQVLTRYHFFTLGPDPRCITVVSLAVGGMRKDLQCVVNVSFSHSRLRIILQPQANHINTDRYLSKTRLL